MVATKLCSRQEQAMKRQDKGNKTGKKWKAGPGSEL